MEDDTDAAERPESLIPYDLWAEDALRQVVVTAIAFAAENGLPGQHHFFVSFRTDMRGVSVPPRLSAKYPQEMTIVLQHQFWDLKLDEASRSFSVGLSFGGVPATLTVPFAAVTGFADPHVQFSLRFRPQAEAAANDEQPGEPDAPAPEAPEAAAEPEPQVVSLAAFRKRSTKED